MKDCRAGYECETLGTRGHHGGNLHIARFEHCDGSYVSSPEKRIVTLRKSLSSKLMAIFSYVRSFVVGSLPLAFALSASQLRLISSVGMGVLVGTSLIVIIPEGVDTLYSAKSHGQKDISSRAVNINWQHEAPVVAATTPNSDPVLPRSLLTPSDSLSNPPPETAVYVTRDEQPGLYERKEEASQETTHEDHEDERSPHAWIGVALVSGFILMYLIDKLPEFASPSKQQRPPYHISLDNLGSGLRRTSSPTREGGFLDSSHSPRRSHSVATTTGLVIHAAADGIALGASSSDTGLSFIIFFAIMVHKAPASFGLTSILLKQGLSSRAARAHLLVFSLAAPVGALATFLFVHLTGSDTSGDTSSIQWRTGMLLLFSGGMFL